VIAILHFISEASVDQQADRFVNL